MGTSIVLGLPVTHTTKVHNRSIEQVHSAEQALIPFIDIERIMKDSLVMIHIEKKKDETRAKLEKKAEEFENKLRNLQEKIKAAQTDDKVSETDLNKMQQNFEAEEINFHNELTKSYKSSEKTFNQAEEQVLEILMEASSHVAQAKNYKLVLNKSIVLIGDKSLDLTQDVMDELNKRIKTIKIDI